MSFILILTNLGHAEDWQIRFDPNGNLLRQTTAAIAPPQILGQTRLQLARPGGVASFFVLAADTRALTYQWRFGDTNIPGATNETLLLTNVGATNEGFYSAVLVNPSGSVTSAPAALMIDGDEDGLSDSWELANFGNLNQYGSRDFDNDGVSDLQEFLDGTSPTNGASAFFRLAALADSGLIEIVPSKDAYTNGEVVTLTATAFAPHSFHGWTGDVNTTNNPLVVVMNSNKTLFAYLSSYDIYWTNSNSGDWFARSNWNPNFVPAPNDNVFITNLSVTVTNNGSAVCRGLTLGRTGFSPTVTGSGTLTLLGDSSWISGNMTGSGRTIVAPGATFRLTPGVFLISRALENRGVITLGNGDLILRSGAVVTNVAGGLIDAPNAGSFAIITPPGRLDNNGTFRKSVGGVTRLGASLTFNNRGTVEIQAGTLAIDGGALNDGAINVAAGTTLGLGGGTFTASAASSITGAGRLVVGAGTMNFAGLLNLEGTHTFNGGVITITGNYICTNNTLGIANSTVHFNGTGVVSPALLTLSSGTMGGSSLVTVLNQMTWSGGIMSGTGRTIIAPDATLTITGAGVGVTTRTLDNAGTVLWTGAANISLNGAVITNRPGALFEARNAAQFSFGGGAPRFDNAGLLRKTVSTGTTTADILFNNYAGVEVLSGTLALEGGGSNTGTMEVSASTTLRLGGSTFNATPASIITGAGRLTIVASTANLAGTVNVEGAHTFNGGTVNLTGDYFCTNNTLSIALATVNFNGTGLVSPATITLTSGALSGSNTVTVLNQMTWANGSMNGRGRTVIATNATLTMNNSVIIAMDSRTLDNAGTVLWTGSGPLYLSSSVASAVITNRPGALFQIANPAGLVWGGVGGSHRFDNAGTFRKTAAGTTSVGSFIAFNNGNTLEILRGVFAPTAGYNSTSNALLHCAIAGTNVDTGYGRLQISGTVTLNGALSVALADGFVPATNDSFAVVTANTRNGTFGNFSYPSNEVTMQLSYTAGSAVVRAIDVFIVSRPVLFLPELSGSNLLLTWTAVSNRTYRLEFNPDLNSSNWNAIPGDVTSLSNSASKLDTLTPGNRFYRVRLLP